ncbi:MAG: glycosyltransferase family 39 protein [Bacteroidales bacterium]|nr:glycosyltransferase family 39 protein [Bacteroidales bacterium]
METKPSRLIRLLSDQRVRLGLYLLLLLPLLLRREITPTNELKYLEIADEALRDGHFWCMFQDGSAYADKPPLYFWIIMAFRRLLGFHCIPLLELFSLLPAFGILAVFEQWCGSQLRLPWRIAAEAALLTTAFFLGGALVLRMDMLMAFFLTLALWIFWKIDRGDSRTGLRWAFGAAVFAAIFTKGPVGFLLPLLAVFVWLLSEHRLRDFGQAWGWRTWLVLAVLCGIWWFCVYREGGREYLDNLLFHQTFGRAVDSFHHDRPWYYYLYSIWYAMGPWALLTIPVSVWGAVRKVGMDPLPRFFLLTSAAFVLLMSCFSAKLQIYLLPVFGLVNYAAFLILQAADTPPRRWPGTLRKVSLCVAGAMLALCVAAGFFFPAVF